MFFKNLRWRCALQYSAGCFLGLILTGGGLLIAAEMRTWTDATGKNKIQGKFVSVEDGKVTLEKKDGTEVEIDLKKLSTADQKFIADLQKEDNPFKSKDDDPFKSKPSGGGGGGGGNSKPSRNMEAKMVSPDYSDATIVSLAPSGEGWKFDVPEAPASTAKSKPKTIATPKKSDFFEKTKGFVGSPSGKFAAIGYMLQKPGVNQPMTTRVVVCDLDKAKMIGEASVPGNYAPLAIHNDGKRLLMKRDEFGFGNADRAEIWTVSGKNASRELQWMPYGDVSGADRDVTWGAFIGDDRLATLSHNGRLVISELEDVKPVFTLQIQGGSRPAISPDQKWLAFSTGKDVGIMDLKEGEVVAMQSIPQVQWPALAFSPGIKQLGMAAFDRLFVWDFATGDLYREMPYQGLHVDKNITWPSDDHVLLGNRILFDLENQVKLWDYQGGEFATQLAGTTWFVVSDGHERPGAVLGAQLPPPAVKDQLAKAMSAPDFFVLKPGTVVKVDVSGIDPAGQEYVKKALAARLKEAGYESGPNGTIDLIAHTEIGKDRQVSYRTIGRLGSSETYTVRDYYTKLKFSYKGQDVWQTQAGGIPHFIHLNGDQTMQQYLNSCMKFNFDWYGKVDLPKLLQKPSQIGAQGANAPPAQVPTVGQTKLTTAGAR